MSANPKRRVPKGLSFRKHLRAAYRSGLEKTIAAALAAANVDFEFETVKVPFVQPEKQRTYTPDFILPNGIVIETKGMFTAEDRKKHVWVKEQHPHLDIRFVFSNANARIRKGSPTRLSDWAENNGFKWAHKMIPEKWLTEKVGQRRKQAVDRLRA